jgi:hypothetical protein
MRQRDDLIIPLSLARLDDSRKPRQSRMAIERIRVTGQLQHVRSQQLSKIISESAEVLKNYCNLLARNRNLPRPNREE